ncbi:TetR/AcrR family transcriptional regulator [Jonesia denitrificans]|uniref:Transcriptional regulator, TetR family n=1 Tax=Jonesia denitrificans (strain ATCC 14870 / DSM 20603 / BCRC 15368 / CIP 55.134 / JCM 11481 / NBRC 15587 / NCTC 10816 / Prevot 55134) TaxID=471856 RepID=C7R3M7_JONDD|nr:TetR/AcrR family transcriptional regulator [Jonesia denitrificans]ACV10172.1 transcriptional regulator, TetR family [Jonesia denitrificans DSM 20603]ASE08608.1 TetR/AcrR family transcriptional regulator [Jonesia denitrificans]QXB43215.1 TetR/AcrR family transcriptional regulator [Jonesia denitrificans]SQH23105.1 HTH-type transcriptional repressor Bm3R1 [Jonesia denitrificans]
MADNTPRSTSRAPRTAPDERMRDITNAARRLFATRGIARTSFTDLAREVKVARGLIYHYFPDKDAIVDAVLADYISEFVRAVEEWDAAREPGNIDKALKDCITVFRTHMRSMDPMHTELQRVENTGLYNRFLHRAVTAIVDCLELTTIEAYAARHKIEISHVRETFYVLIYGLVGLSRNNPAVGDDVLIDITRQILRLPPARLTTLEPRHTPHGEPPMPG